MITDLSEKNKALRLRNREYIKKLNLLASAIEEEELTKGINADKILKWGVKVKSVKIKEKANKILACGTYLELKNKDKTLKIINGNFCHDRYCALCQKIRRTKRYMQMLNVLNILREQGEIYSDNNVIVGMITLTQKNVPAEELAEELNNLNVAIKRLTQSKKWVEAINGFAKSLEITYNREDKTFHPHYHFLVLWNKAEKLTSKDIQELWKRSLRLDYYPQCDIREAYGENANLSSIINECLKYNIKEAKKGAPPLYKDLTLAEFDIFMKAVKNRRFISYSGKIEEIRKQLNYQSEDIEKLADIEISKEIMLPENVEKLILNWAEDKQEYEVTDIRKAVL